MRTGGVMVLRNERLAIQAERRRRVKPGRASSRSAMASSISSLLQLSAGDIFPIKNDLRRASSDAKVDTGASVWSLATV
jgi:hypothetical protein